MTQSGKLTFREFWWDLRSVIVSPKERFALIHERGALWGSLVLMLVPAYFSLSPTGAIYFDRDPFPGYAFIPPLVWAIGVILIKLYPIHLIARLFEGRGKYSQGQGTFRGLAAVLGYTSMPETIALLVFLALFLIIPEFLGSLFRDFRIAAISILIALAAGLFIWQLILGVLALRPVYRIRDLKIVASLILGSVIGAGPAIGLALPVFGEVNVESSYLEPIISQKIMRFFASSPLAEHPEKTRIQIHIDRLVYRFKPPKRFELIAFTSETGAQGHKREIVGRILGLPGDTIELVQGKHRINGESWEEPYVPREYQSSVSFLPKVLGPSQYLVCPENRKLLESRSSELVVERSQIKGRMLVRRWPLGWFLYRPTVFLQAHPSSH